MMSHPHHLVWLRQDLRCHDNTALLAACADPDAAVTAVYALTPGQWAEHDVAGVRIDFELRHLAVLKVDLETLGIPLRIIHAERFDDLPARMAELAQALQVTALHANRQYEVNELARDAAVAAALDVPCQWHEDQCILVPGKVLTGDGRFYTVFSPFKRNWLQQLGPAQRPRGRPAPRKHQAATSDVIPATCPELPSHVGSEVCATLWPVGEQAAHERLSAFMVDDVVVYDSRRDFPAINGTSTLSPYLAAGILSSRQCLAAALQRQAAGVSSDKGLDNWISELCWRDFYKHIVVGFPHVCRHRAFKRETDAIVWSDNDEHFQAWCEGRTGVPIVDAAMRQLRETGWMHNRLRMVVAMFLTKDLFIDWRRGEAFFMRHLIDGDFSANNGGWQWSASTGNDAAPYFRIFNPVLQGQKFDPEGTFVRRFVPELDALPAKRIHEPYAKGQGALFVKYPRPIVDRSLVKDRVLAAFKGLGSTV